MGGDSHVVLLHLKISIYYQLPSFSRVTFTNLQLKSHCESRKTFGSFLLKVLMLHFEVRV